MPLARRAPTAHIPALDGLRGVAILLVLASHTIAHLPDAGGAWPLVALARAGWTGVDLFFVLSGYLITGILLDTRGAPGWLRAFYARRALRIWPLYLLTLTTLSLAALLTAGVLPTEAAAFRRAAPWLWTHTTNLHHALLPPTAYRSPYGTGALWSLAIEEQFYLVWPWVVRACAPARLPVLCVALALGSAATRGVALAVGVSPTVTYVVPLFHLDGLALGSALAAWMRTRARPRTPHWIAARAAALVAFLAQTPATLALGVVAVAALVTWAAPLASPGTAAGQMVGVAGMATVGTLLVATATRPGRLAAALAWAPLRAAGRVSYGLYLLHMPALFATYLAFHWLGAGERWAVPLAAPMTVGLIATAALAALSWRYWERPWLALKRHVPRPAAPVPALARELA